MPSIIGGTTILVGVTLGVLVLSPLTSDSMLLMLVVGTMCLDTSLFLLFCLSGYAEVYVESRETLHQIQCRILGITGVKERRWIRSFTKSCGLVKVKFGGNHFVDELTPLNSLSRALELAVQIILFERTNTY